MSAMRVAANSSRDWVRSRSFRAAIPTISSPSLNSFAAPRTRLYKSRSIRRRVRLRISEDVFTRFCQSGRPRF